MKANELISYIENGELDHRLLDIYLDESKLSYQRERYIKAVDAFTELYPESKDSKLSIISAPGRTEVGGNHTDHQHGQVLAASINDDAIAIVSKPTDESSGNMVHIK